MNIWAGLPSGMFTELLKVVENATPGGRLHRRLGLMTMWSRREVVDYALQRCATLESWRRAPRALRANVCDADPILIRSALHHGEEADTPCPICEHAPMLSLNYVFGEQLGQYSGRIKSPVELEEMQNEFGEFKVCVVEVCTECNWNHMIKTYLLGDGQKRKPPRRRKTVEDIYG